MEGIDKTTWTADEWTVYCRKRELELRIQHLDFEKSRLKSRYQASSREIKQHRDNCEKSLTRLNMEYPDVR